MGRREGHIDSEHPVVAQFAAGLRQLRASAGSPTYRSMAAAIDYAATTLSRAAAGQTLPSLDVVLAYVAACDGDRAEWRRRWEEACAALAPARSTEDSPGSPPAGAARPDHRRPAGRRIAWAALSGVLAIALLAGAVLWTALNQAPASRTLPRLGTSPGRPAVSDGDNPQVDGCAAAGDAQAAALGATEVEGRAVKSHGVTIGYLGLWRNKRCKAEWAEASYLNPHLYPITLESHRPADGATVIDQAIVNLPHDPVIGQLLTTALGCIWARMTLTIHGSKPITVSTPCVR
jgi:hypothetical protein